jgi:hypothetical protein
MAEPSSAQYQNGILRSVAKEKDIKEVISSSLTTGCSSLAPNKLGTPNARKGDGPECVDQGTVRICLSCPAGFRKPIPRYGRLVGSLFDQRRENIRDRQNAGGIGMFSAQPISITADIENFVMVPHIETLADTSGILF